MFEYTIGGKKYIQRKLVLGQVQQLLRLLDGVEIKSPDTLGIIAALGDKIHKALAIVLIPEGVNVKDKNIDEIAEELAFSIEPEQAMKVVEDFFVCTPIISLFQGLNGIFAKVAKQMETQLNSSSASSQQGTSQKDSKSSGR